jgi:hypothetical protein
MACLSDSLVATFVQGRATADEIASVEAHLAECAACRGLVAQLAQLEPLGADTGRTLLDNGAGEPTRAETPAARAVPLGAAPRRGRFDGSGGRWRWPLAGALVLAAVVGGGVAGRRSRAAAERDVAAALAEARAALAGGDGARGAAAAARAAARARAAGAAAAASDARRLESAAWLLAGDSARAVAAASEAEVLAEGAGDGVRALDARLALALAQSRGGDFAGARASLLMVFERAGQLRQPQRQQLAALDLAALARHQGNLAEAERWTAQAAAPASVSP